MDLQKEDAKARIARLGLVALEIAAQKDRLVTEVEELRLEIIKIKAENADYKAGQERYEDILESQRDDIRALEADNEALIKEIKDLKWRW